jgi:hypothetical protein
MFPGLGKIDADPGTPEAAAGRARRSGFRRQPDIQGAQPVFKQGGQKGPLRGRGGAIINRQPGPAGAKKQDAGKTIQSGVFHFPILYYRSEEFIAGTARGSADLNEDTRAFPGSVIRTLTVQQIVIFLICLNKFVKRIFREKTFRGKGVLPHISFGFFMRTGGKNLYDLAVILKRTTKKKYALPSQCFKMINMPKQQIPLGRLAAFFKYRDKFSQFSRSCLNECPRG